MWGEIQLLIDHRYAVAAGVQRVPGNKHLPVEFNPSAVGRTGAAEDFHQRTLAGSVFPDECVDLTGRDLERNVFQRVSCPEALVRTHHSQAWGHSFRYLAIGG